jgi:hypothetical protein
MKTSQFKPFFTKDLIVDKGEPVNAFWGYHLGNNYTRLMGVDGTLYFKARRPWNWEQGFEDLYFDVPIGNYGFHSVPVVQLFNTTIAETSYGTVLAYGLDYGMQLTTDLNQDANRISIYIDPSNDEHGFNANEVENLMRGCKIAGHWFAIMTTVSEELMFVTNYEINYTPVEGMKYGKFNANLEVQRGWYVSSPDNHTAGDKVLIMPNDGVRLIPDVTTSVGTNLYPNSPLVEGIMDTEKLRVRWLYDYPGTVMYKIFGV